MHRLIFCKILTPNARSTLLSCIVELSAHQEFHSLQWSSVLVRSILLHLSMLDPNDCTLYAACLHTLALIFRNSVQFKKDSVGQNFDCVRNLESDTRI